MNANICHKQYKQYCTTVDQPVFVFFNPAGTLKGHTRDNHLQSFFFFCSLVQLAAGLNFTLTDHLTRVIYLKWLVGNEVGP